MNPSNTRFNLVDEPWIPVIGKGMSSLREVFGDSEIPGLGGNPIQKIALTKLLLAIGQAAYTPKDKDALDNLDIEAFRSKCLNYLDKWYDRFWLYGELPFLQMPGVKQLIDERHEEELRSATTKAAKKKAEANAEPRPIGAGFYPDVPAENNTILTQHQIAETTDDADKVLFIITLMNFALAGKRIEKNLSTLTPGFAGMSASAKPGPSIGNYIGYLHSFLVGPTLLDSIMLNMLSFEQISANPYWKSGLGSPPWERMPDGEGCEVANMLKDSYMATLVSLSRFVLLEGDGIYYVEGLQYPSHKNGWSEPSMLINFQDNTPKVVWVDPNRRPWRELPGLLAFLNSTSSGGYGCLFIKYGLDRAKRRYQHIGIWSGGLRVSPNAGDQSVKQDDDFVESLFTVNSTALDENWYDRFHKEMEQLEQVSKALYSATYGYFQKQGMEGKSLALQATTLFWQMSERKFQELIDACEEIERLPLIRKSMGSFAINAFNTFCPRETVRQIDAWANSRPNFSKYLSNN
jgi:CRISPR system Cascade subunit CasA